MTQFKQHTFSFIALVLLLAVLLPSVVKMGHVFESHKHDVCKGEKTAHVHEIDSDCEFYDFHLNSDFQLVSHRIQFETLAYNFNTTISHYCYKNENDTSGISLRGPPQA
jgi:hypothetical protein